MRESFRRTFFLKLFGGLVLCSALLKGQTTTLSATVAAEASIVINTATTTLTAGTTFTSFTGTTSFTYKIRTSVTSGAGNIQLEITSDFTPANGPSVASPPTAGDKLAYTCTVSTPATQCATSLTASTTAQTSVGTFGADAHSASAGNSGSVSWSLTDDPVYKTNTYTAVATFTISAT